MLSKPQRPSAIADELAVAIGGDRVLMLQQVGADVRPAFEALFQVDAAMADVVARATQPALGAVKLAWWRERLEELDRGKVPAEPRLAAAAQHLVPRGISGSDLSRLEAGWATLFDETPDPRLVAERGAVLFELGGRLLGKPDERLADAGRLYALLAVGRRGLPELLGKARPYAERLAKHRFDRRLRPLTALARLAERDLKQGEPFEEEGIPPRLAAMLRHRWSGIVV
jgi:15-cis-phytoene synthase